MKKWQIALKRSMQVVFFLSVALFIFLIFVLHSDIKEINYELNNVDVLDYRPTFRSSRLNINPRCVGTHGDSFGPGERQSELCDIPAVGFRYMESHYIDNLDEIIAQSDITIYVYGGSSVVAGTRDAIFSNTIERKLNDRFGNVTVVNFGAAGLDSAIVRDRVISTIGELGAPDFVIIYSGHNDYTNGFFHTDTFNPTHYLREVVDKFPLTLSDRMRNRLTREAGGPLLNFLQSIRVVSFDGNDFEPINDLVLDNYKENIEEINQFLIDKDVDTIYITTIGNLEAEPYGDIKITRNYYRKGMKSRDYDERVGYLRKAMDSEIFTHDIRAHSDLNDYLRNLAGDRIHVFDLERELIERRFDFGSNDFIDYLHFTGRTHLLIGDLLYEMMVGDLI